MKLRCMIKVSMGTRTRFGVCEQPLEVGLPEGAAYRKLKNKMILMAFNALMAQDIDLTKVDIEKIWFEIN